ncbi:MAG: WhiB family transcriptional regulator [Egibacteraceae bacterium]
MSWRDKAACLGADPDLFFPVGTTGPAAEQADWAKAICADCPVRDACLDTAIAHGELGIWGGTDEEARARIRRRGGRPPRCEVKA